MIPAPNDTFQALQERICFMLSNRMTYPQTVLQIASGRLLTPLEIQKAAECLKECVQFVDAELTLFRVRNKDKLED